MNNRSKSSLLYIMIHFYVYSVKVITGFYLNNTSVLDAYISLSLKT